MKRTAVSLMIGLCLGGLLTLGLASRGNPGRGSAALVPEVHAQSPVDPLILHGPKPCSNGILIGDYGVRFNGSAPGFGSFTAVGLGHFDGQGHITGTGTANVNDMILEGPVTGVYTIFDNCSGTGTVTYTNLGLSVTGKVVVVADGKEAHFIATAPQGILLEGAIRAMSDPQIKAQPGGF